ncbi:MAG: ABC transporter ATP-binding protein/permease [Defluviitaleaceae bacterium]|nr:ABC transporter ATP-binding protein/permease [Defluviitaleaceae bacterium]
MGVLQKLRKILDRGTKIRLFIVLVGIIIGAGLEVLALSIISPLISVLLDPNMVYDNPFIFWVYDFVGFGGTDAFLAFLTFALAGIYIIRGAYLYLFSKIKFRFIARRQAMMSNKMMRKIMGFSYIYHANNNGAVLQRTIIEDIFNMFSLITNLLMMLMELLMMLFILVFLVIVSPIMTLFVVLLAAICVILYLKAFRNAIRVAGQRNRSAHIGMRKTVNQALGGIKEVKVLRRETYFSSIFNRFSDVFVKENTRFQTLNVLPKLVIEAVCFGGAFALVGFFILVGTDITGIVPQLSVFVLAAFRLLPAIGRLVSQYNMVVYNLPSVDAVYRNLFEEETRESNSISTVKPVDGSGVYVRGLSYEYPNATKSVLNDVNLDIPENKSVAFVGPSGAGKTTLADLILGILTPVTGSIFHKGRIAHNNFDEWGQHIGYIPQQIYLLDETILENVAFGIDREKIDEDMVWKALEQAQLVEFVKSLPGGLETVVGDRGIRLSGGQRQRMGIARALYADPSILVLDEATSSLDDDTEKAVMDAIVSLAGKKTMLIIAHRLSTIEHCDIVYRIENGSVNKL